MLHNLQKREFQPTVGSPQLPARCLSRYDLPQRSCSPSQRAVPREPTIWEPTLGQDNRIDPRICRHTIYLWKPQWQSKQDIDTVRISVTSAGMGLRLTCRRIVALARGDLSCQPTRQP